MAGKTGEVAKMLVREVPLSQLAGVLGHTPGPNAMGDGCGGGCGGGAGCYDAAGHSGLTSADIKAALKDKAALKAAAKAEILAHGNGM